MSKAYKGERYLMRRWHQLLLRFRGSKIRWVLLASALLATALVLGALVGRQRATRTGTEAHIPLRQLSVDEAAALFRDSQSDTEILSLSADEVVFGTGSYPVRGNVPERISAAGTEPYSIVRANWEEFYSRYVIAREPLERALGRRLGPGSVRPEAFAERRLSFDASWVAGYVLCEVAFFSAWIALFVLALQRLRRWTLVLPAVWLWLLLPVAFALRYSPAFYDADFFFQRVLVERVALLSMWALIALTLPAGLSLFVWAALFSSEKYAQRAQKSPTEGEPLSLRTARYRRRTLWVLAALAASFVLMRVSAYFLDRSTCLDELAALESRVDARRLDAALTMNAADRGALHRTTLSPPVRAAIEEVLAVAGAQTTGPELLLFIPTDRAFREFLFLWRNGFAYADIRTLGDDFGNQIDASFLATLDEEPRTSSWLRSLSFERPMCGRRSQLGGRRVTAAVKLDRR